MTDPRTLIPKLPALKLFINGQFVEPENGATIPVRNPATGLKICDAPAASASDVDTAVKAARAAFDAGTWSGMSPGSRARMLRKFADLIWSRREELGLLESMNNGKTFTDAVRGDVGPAAATLHYCADIARAQAVPVTCWVDNTSSAVGVFSTVLR